MKKPEKKPRAKVDPALVDAATFMLYEVAALLAQEVEESGEVDQFLMSMGSICASDIPREASVGRARLVALGAALRDELEADVQLSAAGALYQELIDVQSELAWRLSPFRTLPEALREGLPGEATYDDIVPLAGAAQNLARFLYEARALPAPLARRAARAKRWAHDLVTVDEGGRTEAFEELYNWSLDPAEPIAVAAPTVAAPTVAAPITPEAG